MRKILPSVFVLLVFLSSCKVFDPEESIPSFIKIEKVNFDAAFGQGTDSVVVNDVWVYVDDEAIGAFELPATIPILKSGEHKVMLKFGVILNGISATRSINPFFSTYTKSIVLVPDSIITIVPNVTYTSNTKFIWNSVGQEGFEDGGVTLDSVKGSEGNLVKSSTTVFEGNYSGQIHLDTATPFIAIGSTTLFPMPTGGSKSKLLEFHCLNTTTPIKLGILAILSNGTITQVEYLEVHPGPHWKKIYMNMSQLLEPYLTYKSYRIYVTGSLGDKTQADIYLDNIKYLSF